MKSVESLVVIPGWVVTYGKDAARNIRDPHNVVAFLDKQEQSLNQTEVATIAGKLEAWCRVLKFDPDEES